MGKYAQERRMLSSTFQMILLAPIPLCACRAWTSKTVTRQDAVARLLHKSAFILQAIQSPPPSQAWHSAAENLDIWSVEHEDVLRHPGDMRKEKRVTLYKPQRWKGFVRSPTRTRSRCLPLESGTPQPSNDGNDDHESPSPTLDRVGRRKETSVI
ncbi:hypothetical protein TOPH_06755 [Tolypocladium ophioglossoides CBS 100239]|uniref:Uncharacterized protein n=1 Tax=Tolypocladium ophioglossoides (strain CBS 100239) TaxID=1163406 RepID=A0A0L0N3C4_TOLOC|nr:hypothetical protein TOPH_06755 [Tolypocladium ophioglossoides CBS 100239]